MLSARSITLKLERGHTLLVTGPAQVRLNEGSAQCFGAQIKNDEWTVVEGFRQQPLLTTDPSTIELRLGSGSSWKEVSQSTIPVGWSEAANLLQRQGGVTVVVGEVDAGKSSLCTFLANKCLDSGMRVGLVDGDVGQADIGPPATIGSSELDEPIIALHQAKAKTSFFIGDTSPSYVPEKVIRLLVRLKQELTDSSDVVLVNTDGWIGDPAALRFKKELLDETHPDLVLGLARIDETNPIFDLADCASLRLVSSPYAKIRSKEERKTSREAGYRRFLLGAKPVRISYDDARLRMFDHPEQSILPGDRRFRGFLTGLLNDEQELLGIGRIRDVDKTAILVETPTTERPTFLEVGNPVLSPHYEEVGYGTLH